MFFKGQLYICAYIYTYTHMNYTQIYIHIYVCMYININNLIYVHDTTLMAEIEKEPKRLLMRMKGESEKIVFNLSIKKTNITASRSNISWQTEGEKREAMTDFILGGFKITADSDYRHEIKRCLPLKGRL